MTEILSHKPKTRRFNFRAAMEFAARQRGVAAWRIGLEAMLLSLGSRRLSGTDYFLHGAWRPGLTWAERRSFVGSLSNRALNDALHPPSTPEQQNRVRDKLTADRHFRAAGLPVAEIRAVAAASDPGGDHRWLASPEAVLAYLREPGALPCFGKPVHGSAGIGAVRLDGWEDDGSLRLGDGRRVGASELVAEIWAKHSEGFLFAEIVHPHPDLARLIGPVIGTLRVVTIDAGEGPEVLYAVQKIPAPGAMVDSTAGPIGGYASVDLASGRVLREQDRKRMGGLENEASAASGRAIAGESLPDFAAARDLARAAHSSLGAYGILGIDILLSDRGPLVNEANANPHHSAYQIATARGVLNPDFLPRLLAVRARVRAVTPRPKHCPLK